MKAFVHTRYGSPDVLSLTEVKDPVAAAGQIRVRVHATTVNRTDIGFRTAKPALVRAFSGWLKPKFAILGTEFSGVVDEVGSGVTRFKVGDVVCGTTGEAFGAHAELLCLSETGPVVPKPAYLTHREAAGLADGAYISLCYLRAAEVGPGTRILINGTTGAIGTAAVQLAKALGAHITAVADTPRLALPRSLGADAVIDYKTTDFTKAEGRFDVVFDAVGMSSYGRCRHLLTETGMYLSTELGDWCQNPFLALFFARSRGRKVKFPIPMPNQADIRVIAELASAGKFKAIVDRVVPFDTLIDATRYVELGHKTGNVVVELIHP